MCTPAGSVPRLALVATPALRGTGAPKLVPSTWNCTVPVGGPRIDDAGVTVAVKVTAWPKLEGSGEPLTVVVVEMLTGVTVMVTLPVAVLGSGRPLVVPSSRMV